MIIISSPRNVCSGFPRPWKLGETRTESLYHPYQFSDLLRQATGGYPAPHQLPSSPLASSASFFPRPSHSRSNSSGTTTSGSSCSASMRRKKGHTGDGEKGTRECRAQVLQGTPFLLSCSAWSLDSRVATFAVTCFHARTFYWLHIGLLQDE